MGHSTRLTARQGDLTAQEVDAIVNAANEQLQHGGGVAAAIVRAGGASIQEESNAWVSENGPVRPGEAALTGAGALSARWVIHVVGPRYAQGQDNKGRLAEAVTAALDAAAAAGASSVAMPAISTGIFGYPPDEAVPVIVAAARRWADEHPDELQEVRFVGYDETMTDRFRLALD